MISNDAFYATVGMLPFCEFCKAEGKQEYARYDFRVKNADVWRAGCVAHFQEHAMFNVLGEGKGMVLCIPRPGSMIGNRVQLMPMAKRAVYKPTYLFVVDEDNHGWEGLGLSDRGQPTNATIFPYQKNLWRDVRAR